MSEYSLELQLVVICLLLLLILLISYYIIRNKNNTNGKGSVSKHTITEYAADDIQHQQEQKLQDLFLIIDEVIQTEKLYTNPQLSKSDLTIRFNTNRNKLNQVLQQGCGMGYSQYICELRLKESVRLMQSNKTMPLNDVAELCGFKTYSSFYRHFTKKFNTSPADFKDKDFI